jgi:hypothetical protein
MDMKSDEVRSCMHVSSLPTVFVRVEMTAGLLNNAQHCSTTSSFS